MAHDLDVLIGETLEDRRVVRRAALGRQLWEEGWRAVVSVCMQGRGASRAALGSRPYAALRSSASEAIRRNQAQSPYAPLRSSASRPP